MTTTSPVLPIRARKHALYVETYPRRRFTGWQVLVDLSNGETIRCDHAYNGHRTEDGARACATKIVARVNAAAGR